MGFGLENIVSTNERFRPQKHLVHAVRGTGKTTFGSTFPNPIFLRSEDGAYMVKAKTFPNIVKSFADTEGAINALHGDHEFKTFVIDVLDGLEPIVWAKTIKERPFSEKGAQISHIEDYGFGKGYIFCLDWWKHLLNGFDSLCENKGMNIVLLAHSEVKRYDPPETAPYDRYRPKMHQRAAGLVGDWADNVLFINFKTDTEVTENNFGKEKRIGKGTGKRLLYTEVRPAFVAKSKIGLPPLIRIGADKSWANFHKEIEKIEGE